MSRNLWDDVVNKHLVALSAPDQQRVSRILDYASFQAEIGGMFTKYTSKTTTTCLQRLKPVFDHLHNFTNAIGIMVQSNPAIAALVWGSVVIILGIARKSTEILEHITGQLIELQFSMPLFEKYLDLYPRRPDLQDAIRNIYDSYVSFLVNAITFCERSWFANFMSPLSWSGGLSKKMQETKATLKSYKSQFDDVQHLAGHEVLCSIQSVVAPRARNANKVNTLDISYNDFFFGREQVLHDLYDVVGPAPNSKLKACVLHGLGGAGKTQTAIRYIHDHEGEYSYIFWIRAEEPARIAKAFGEIALKAVPGTQASANQQSNIEAALNWLNRTDKAWLIVFDNVNLGKHITPYVPKSNGSVIITTQIADVKQMFANSIAVKTFDPEDGARLLQTYLEPRQENFDECCETSRLVGGLPLSIAHIAGFLARSGTTLTEFQDLFHRRESSAIWNSSGQTTSDYERSLETAFDIALQALAPEARNLLDILAFMDPDCILENMVFREPDTSRPGSMVEMDIAKKLQLREALHGRYLVERTPTTDPAVAQLSVHRSVKRSLLFKLDRDPAYRQDVFERALAIVRDVVPRQDPTSTPTNHDWPRFERYLPHVLSLNAIYTRDIAARNPGTPPLKGTMEFAELLCDVGNYMWERYLINNAFVVLEAAKQICEDVLQGDDSHPVRTQIMYLIASFELNYGSTKRFDGLKHKQEILQLRESRVQNLAPDQVSRVDRLQLSTAYNNLGGAYLHCDDYEQAEPMLQRSLDMKRQVCDEAGDPDSFHFAESLKNLAICAMSKGDAPTAFDLSNQSVARMEAWSQAGPRTKAACFFRYLRASHMYNSGNTDAALLENIQVLKLREEVLGKVHDHTLDSYYAVGFLYYRSGNLAEAERHLETCLDRRQYYYETRLPRVLYVLSLVHQANGKRADARRCHQEAQDMRDQLVPAACPGIDLTCGDELRIYEQMCNIWSGRFSGKQNFEWQKSQKAPPSGTTSHTYAAAST